MVFAPKCPSCQQPIAWEGNSYRPFCSERCQLIDLGSWVSERYRVAGDPVDAEHDDEDVPDDRGSS